MPGFFALAVALGAAASVAGALVGGWKKTDVTAEETELLTSALARVDAENGPQLRLSVVEILSLETQVVAGTNYRFTVAARDISAESNSADGAESDAPVGRFQVKVFEQPWTNTLRVTAVDRVYSAGDEL